jgi:Alw26I/Eco31I/Esp3I family type II restriction endonuclease
MDVSYGRGKFDPANKYVEYIKFIVNHKNYAGMPNAIDPDTGKVNWQVSSGKTTSFYKYYLARRQWWIDQADRLRVPGVGTAQGRLTTAARLIHPTGIRPCLVCGKEWHVGYMYLNKNLAARWNRLTNSESFFVSQSVVDAAYILLEVTGDGELLREFQIVFSEKSRFFPASPADLNIEDFFEKTTHIKGTYLSPGYMGNPPDRLDGFHDYGSMCCRKKHDPGRSDENMRTYNHDRRAFQWWTEGDWLVADALYNRAGAGQCVVCGETVTKISPDHVGPLSCGFKHMPFFEPMCVKCNSSKNRRFTYRDVQILINYEQTKEDSVASWQVRALWDETKNLISNDEEAKSLSNIMRALQDYYLRVLHKLFDQGMSLFLTRYLSPESALYEVKFTDLDPSTLRFKSFQKTKRETPLRLGLAARSMRIAFDELLNYTGKELEERKLRVVNQVADQENIEIILAFAKELVDLDDESTRWDEALKNEELNQSAREKLIASLMIDDYQASQDHFVGLDQALRSHFDAVGRVVAEQFREELED